MLNLIEIFVILIIHWIADFILQTDKMAKGKSNNWYDLLDHTFTYSLVWLIAGLIYGFVCLFTGNEISLIIPIFFFMITLICHTATDYVTSRINKILWNKGDVHNFFVSVGFDQILHYVQLYLTYYLLFK